MNEIIEGFKVMLFGMGGVFLVLFLLYLVSKLLLKLFPAKRKAK